MKRLWIIIVILFVARPLTVLAQTQVNVTGRIFGATSGYVQFVLQPQSSSIHFYVRSVATLAPQTTTCSISSSGNVLGMGGGVCLVWGNDVITPANTTYQVVFAPGGTITNRVNRELITGSTYDLDSPVFSNPVNIVPQFQTITAPPIAVNLIPAAPNSYTIGTASSYWASAYIGTLFANQIIGTLNSASCVAGIQMGIDAGNKITACATSLGPNGGTIDAQGITGDQFWSSCPVFPKGPNTGNSAFTLILGAGDINVLVSCVLPISVRVVTSATTCFNPSAATTLEIDGNISADSLQQIFCGSGTVITPFQPQVTPQWWGALQNATFLGGPLGSGTSGCNGTSGGATITCASGKFTSSDAGKSFDLAHGGVSNCGQKRWGRSDGPQIICNLVGTIASVNSSTSVTLSTNLQNNVSGEIFTYGTADNAPVQAALNSGASSILLLGMSLIKSATPPTSTALTATMKNAALFGTGGNAGFVHVGPVVNDTHQYILFFLKTNSINVNFTNVKFFGTDWAGELENAFVQEADGFDWDVDPISQIHFTNCDFSYHWGIGNHNINNSGSSIFISSSRANFNGFTGLNVNNNDGLFIDDVQANNNASGGIELSPFGTFSLRGSQVRFNGSVGVSIGGFQGIGGVFHNSQITGNDISSNGNSCVPSSGCSGTTSGLGLAIVSPAQGVTVTGNTIWRNNVNGINFNNQFGNIKDVTITGNVISTNGLSGGNGGLGTGIVAAGANTVITGNQFDNEERCTIVTASRSANVVTVTCTTANNWATGNSVTIAGTPGGVFDGTFTITAGSSLGTQFTFPQVAANLANQLGGQADNNSWPVYQGFGIELQNISGLNVAANDFRNQFNAAIHLEPVSVSTFSNVVIQDNHSAQGNGCCTASGIRIEDQVPSLNGAYILVPDIATTVNACTTAASAGSTCTVAVGHFIGITPNLTRCYLDNSPNAQTGVPIISKVDSSTDANHSTITITAMTNVAAGGGTMRCRTNFAY